MAKKDLYIELNNSKCKVYGSLKKFNKLRTDDNHRCRNPNAFFIRKHMQPGWDGKFYIITDAGYFFPGHLPSIIIYIEEQGWSYKINDVRSKLEFTGVPTQIGELDARPYQIQAVKAVLSRRVENIYFPVGVLNMATNAGKTLMMAMIHLSFKNPTSIILLNDGDLYKQFKRELPELILDDNIGYIQGKEKTWGNINVVMVQTIARNIDKYKDLLAKVNIVMVDECDLANNKTYKSIMKYCFNSTVTIGLSGSIYQSKLAKHKIKNFELKGQFSNIVSEISKETMMAKGFSCKVVIKIIEGNTEVEKYKKLKDWQEVYRDAITRNKVRHQIITDRLLFNLSMDRITAMIVCRYHEHIQNLYDFIKPQLPSGITINMVHGGTPEKQRKQILEDFRLGKLDILIASYIVKRGKNFPLLQYICNASGSDNQETISQITGRGERTHESKKKVLLDDIYDRGKYLERHSKHRVSYYMVEKLKVINKVKPNGKRKKK